MQLVHTSVPDRTLEMDGMRWLVDAIAQELWTLYSVSGTLNWAGVERHLSSIVEGARSGVRDSRAALVSVVEAGHSPAPLVERRRRAKPTGAKEIGSGA